MEPIADADNEESDSDNEAGAEELLKVENQLKLQAEENRAFLRRQYKLPDL